MDPDLATALRSGTATPIAQALEALELGEPPEAPVPMPTADMLAPLGPVLPDDVASRFVRLLDRFDAFTPPPSRADVERELALAAARYGPTSLGLEASLVLKQATVPGEAVLRALAAVAGRGVREGEAAFATAFVSYLLAGRDDVRAATVEALATWRGRPDLAPVVEGVVGELEDDESARLGR